VQLLLDAFEGDPLADEGARGGGSGGGAGGAPPLGVASSGTGTKYLTSSKLLRLELRDAAFRRSLLLQLTLLLRYARGPPPPSGGTLKPAAAEAAAALAARAAACLQAVPPAGKAFAAAVEAAMERDRNWVLWKAAGCKVRRAQLDPSCFAIAHTPQNPC
jgi:THO complex subunit 1